MTEFKTIKAYAQHLLLETDFVDCWGRNVGHDYGTILSRIKLEFPQSQTSMRALRLILYSLDPKLRLPARRRSRKMLATDFARTLLLRTNRQTGRGLQLHNISTAVRVKFPDVAPSVRSIPKLRKLAASMKRAGFAVPDRGE